MLITPWMFLKYVLRLVNISDKNHCFRNTCNKTMHPIGKPLKKHSNIKNCFSPSLQPFMVWYHGRRHETSMPARVVSTYTTSSRKRGTPPVYRCCLYEYPPQLALKLCKLRGFSAIMLLQFVERRELHSVAVNEFGTLGTWDKTKKKITKHLLIRYDEWNSCSSFANILCRFVPTHLRHSGKQYDIIKYNHIY